MSNAIETNYFKVFLQNVDVDSGQPLIGFHLNPPLISHFYLLIITQHISRL